ncbi:unnamed protein product [Rhizophagus irregularis]|uniref:Uncharacterized protein n=1 Tax=Rhizophagus irregularis TaxID=588596 RepID=A0A2I1FXS6_9GLOM|nr:hypothetical protein RhiirA4_537887 [Rhizophagus irregularis]CAB4435709.1 unnamed protein product [Rhizophagus irregularis]CAB4435814.1 unnamed protein product [Rhizophagus irregularis]
MKGQYQSMYMYNSPPIISSYSNNFSPETNKDEINSYNSESNKMKKELTNYSSSIEPSYIINSNTFNPTKNNDYFINIFEDSKDSKDSKQSKQSNFNNFNKNLSSPLSSLSSSSNSSTISLSLPSPSIYSPSSLSSLSTQSTQNNSLLNELSLYIKPYSYEPLYMKVPEIKKEFIKFKPKPNFFFPKFNIIFFRPFTIYPSGKIDRIWRYLIIWSILLSLICYLDPFEAKYLYRFITPIKYFVICLTVISLIFRVIIIFVQNDSFKSYIKSYTTTSTTNTTSNTTNENNNNTSSQTYTETQQQQEDATVINMEQNNQLTTNTRDAQDENSGGFAKSSLFGGCCDGCYCCSCCNGGGWGANCRDSLNYCLAGCLNALCCFSFNSAASN